jgi:hypothetical protein
MVIRVEAPDIRRASSLMQALVRVHEAEELSLDGETHEILIRTRGDSGHAVLRVLDALEAWLAADGLPSTRIHFEGRSYRIHAPAEEVEQR